MKTIIKDLRQEVKMSQRELGDSVGVTRQTINALENGRYNPSLLLAYNITKVLNERFHKGNVDNYFTIEEVFLLDEKFDDGDD
ncbi:helix-turn-helix transcriptional regulator [uncultured Methanobrevibacter sp.]|uniref:helix-turn-helix transcriptional regulator n=1 Tax=uncultured Methanobrevibacter sp. TaxID=253161 RepID=UPI0026369AA5